MRFFAVPPLFLSFVIALTTGLFACRESENSPDPMLARVGEQKLMLSEMRLAGPWDSLSIEERSERVENWISRESIYAEALQEGVDRDSATSRLIEDAKRVIVLSAYFSKITDTLTVSDADASAYYEDHPEDFIRNQNSYRIALVEYASPSAASRYYGSSKKASFAAAPEKNAMIRQVETFDSVTVAPFSCPGSDLSKAPVGKLSPPRACENSWKSVVVLSRQDSGASIPFSEVSESAHTYAAIAKRKHFIAAFKNGIRKEQTIFIYPEEISR